MADNHARNYEHVLAFALDHPWAVTRPMLRVIAGIVGRRVAGLKASDDELAAALVQRRPQPAAETGAVAVLPIYGVLSPRANMLAEMSGGTSYQALSGLLRGAVADASISTIVLDIDSPGGSVAGASEFAREVLAARTSKKVIAVAQYQCCSAAYWIAAMASEVVAAPSALVGSIGVYTIHDDISAALAAEGVSRTYISAGKHKVDGNETAPLSDDALAQIQALVDDNYTRFITDVALGRGTKVAAIKGGYGEGRAVTATEAKSLGMVDRIASLDETITRALGGKGKALTATAPQILLAGTDQELPPAATSQDRPADTDQHVALALLDF